MSVFVVGGTGFIGLRLVRRLIAKGQDVVCMDINPIQGVFHDAGDHVKIVRGDVTQFDEVMDAMAAARPERTVNLSYFLEGGVPPRRAMKLNVLGMDNFFEASRLCGARHVVYASSLGVHGTQKHYGERPVTEDDYRHGTGQYAMHKIFNEWQACDYAERFGMVITGIRPANVTGPDKVRGSIDHVNCITQPARGNAITFPYKDAPWCPIHVEDTAEVFARITLSDKPRHAIYNTGGATITLGGIAAIVREFIPDARITFENETGGADSTGLNYLIDNTRLIEEFGIQYPPFRQRALEIINDVRAQQGQPAIPT